MPTNDYLSDEEKTRREILNGGGLNGEEVASQYLAGLNPQLPEVMKNPSREQMLKAALKMPPTKAAAVPSFTAENAQAEDAVPQSTPVPPDAGQAPNMGQLADHIQKTRGEENPLANIKFDPEAFSQALYAAGTRTALPAEFFQRKLGREMQQNKFDNEKEIAGIKAHKESELDYSSPSARAEQSLFNSINKWADPEKTQYMTSKQLKEYKKFGLDMQKQDETERKNAATEKYQDANLEERRIARQANYELRKLGLTEQQTQRYSEAFAKHQTGLNKDLVETHANIEQIFDKLPPEVKKALLSSNPQDEKYGFDYYKDHADLWKQRVANATPLFGGAIQSLMGDSPEAIRNRAAENAAWTYFKNVAMHKLIGGNQSKDEAGRVDPLFGDKMFENPAARLAAINMFRQIQAKELQAQEGALRLQVPDDAFHMLSVTGLTSENPLYANAIKKIESSNPGSSNSPLLDQQLAATDKMLPPVPGREAPLSPAPNGATPLGGHKVEEPAATEAETTPLLQDKMMPIKPGFKKQEAPAPAARKAYSKSQNKTYLMGPSGEVLSVQDGDTRGK